MKTGTREWANRNCNLSQTGCEHDCLYCYAKEMAIRYKRATPESWKTVQHGFPRKIPRRKIPGVTMFPTAHDITMANAEACRDQIVAILASGDDCLVVTKARPDALKIALDHPAIRERMDLDRIEVRITIGSYYGDTLTEWEPGAPPFEERMKALRLARLSGFTTSVSAEPLLDADPERLIQHVRPFASSIWLGFMKKAVARVERNNPGNHKALGMAAVYQAEHSAERAYALWMKYRFDHFIKFKDTIRAMANFWAAKNGLPI